MDKKGFKGRVNRVILSLAKKLYKSKRYEKIKDSVKDLLNNPANRYKKYLDGLIIFLIISSVLILIYEVKIQFQTGWSSTIFILYPLYF